MDCLNPVESIYGEQNSNEDKKISIFDKLSTNVDEASKIADKIAIKEMIEKLNDREREIILLRYYKEKTQTQVSKILGITQVQVSRIERKILEQMKSKLVS